MKLTGWGQYPSIESNIITPLDVTDILNILSSHTTTALAVRGLGRSYGDSSLAPDVIDTSHLNHLLAFDETSGMLTCAAGVSLADILSVFVPKGWFLPVTPGTEFVTVGGAVASDVHGKNHHLAGSFSDHVSLLKVATVSDGIIECSREHHPELFHATCGGMGLTGIILEVTFKLTPIKSAYINVTRIRAKNLEEALNLFEKHQQATYSVAWIDCSSTGKSLGRSVLMLGEHAQKGALTAAQAGKLFIPVNMPSALLNRYTIQVFNSLYYHRVLRHQSSYRAHYQPFFYPLDRIHHWNRMYGKRGFTQYQCVLPKQAGLAGMTTIIQRIAASKRGSFLAVLKMLGKANDNFLSFPMEGYTLALDFKLAASPDRALFELLNALDDIVLEYGGRVYLTKDARMSEKTFKQSYPKWEEFMRVRKMYGADRLFHSLQSQRLGL